MTVKCCEKCGRDTADNCSDYKNCLAWRMWFAKEWEAIRKCLNVQTQEK